MAKIPTVNPEVGLRVANMPNLPRSVASSMSAPGRAQQGLGRAIGGMAGAFKDQGPSEEDQFNDKLEMLKAGNELEFNERKTQAEYNPSENDPSTYHEGRKGHFESWAAGVRQRIKDPRKAELFIERNRGRFNNQTYQFGSQQKVRKSISTVESAINGEISKLDPVDRKTFDANFADTMRGVNGMIDAMPGVTSAQKDALRARAAQQGMKMVLSKIPPGERLPALKKMIERWDAEGAAANEGPSRSEPGAKSPRDVLLEDTRQRFDEVNKEGGGDPNELAIGALSPVDEKRLKDAGFDPQKLTWGDFKEKLGGAKPEDAKPGKYKIYGGGRAVPSSAERRKIFKNGGVVVNLDTNWSKGSQTSPMVVIPDGATPQQRKAAEAYAAKVAEVYAQKFGKSLKPKVVTRSQNGRGRAATIHTEPFAVTDKSAVEYFRSDEGATVLADITRSTLGTIPGVQFSLPHGGVDGKDKGSHGNGTNEVELAQGILKRLASNDPSGSTGPVSPNTPSVSSSSVQSFMRKGITAMMPQLIKEHEKAVALLKQRTRVAGMISGQEAFNPFGADKKIVDDTFAAGDLHKRMFAGDQDAIMKGVEISQRLNYVPKPVGDALQGLANHEDPKARVMALEAAGSILARNPNALDNTDLGSLKKDAESYVALTTGIGKRSPKEALERMIEMKSPEWKKKAEARKAESNELVKNISSSDVNQALGNWAERNLPFMNPNISNTDIVTSEYKKSFVEHFTRWGDEDMAHKLAANDLKKVYGPTTVRGSTEVMMYPPDRSYPPIGEKGHEYLSDDIVEAVTANLHERAKELLRVSGGDPSKAERSEIDMSDIQLIPDARTAREVAANKPPTYKIMFMVPGDYGVQVPVVMRWGLSEEDIEAARAKWSSKTLKDRPALLDKEAEQSKAQEAQRERFKESDAIDREFDERIRKYREERAAP